jgi:hypothetical protein
MKLFLRDKIMLLNIIITVSLLSFLCCSSSKKVFVLPQYSVYNNSIKTDYYENLIFIKIIVSDNVKKEDLKALLDTLYMEKKRNPVGGDPSKRTSVKIYAYTSEKHALASDSLWYGRIERIGSELSNHVKENVPQVQ